MGTVLFYLNICSTILYLLVIIDVARSGQPIMKRYLALGNRIDYFLLLNAVFLLFTWFLVDLYRLYTRVFLDIEPDNYFILGLDIIVPVAVVSMWILYHCALYYDKKHMK